MLRFINWVLQLDKVAPDDPFESLSGFYRWLTDKVEITFAWMATAALYGGLIYFTLGPTMNIILHGKVGDFATCMLAVIGAYTIVLLVNAAADDELFNPWRIFKNDGYRMRNKRGELFDTLKRPGTALLVAWIITNWLT